MIKDANNLKKRKLCKLLWGIIGILGDGMFDSRYLEVGGHIGIFYGYGSFDQYLYHRKGGNLIWKNRHGRGIRRILYREIS